MNILIGVSSLIQSYMTIIKETGSGGKPATGKNIWFFVTTYA